MTGRGIELKCLENPSENWHMLVDGYLESRADNPMTAMITGFNATGREQSINSFRAMVQSINLPVVIAWDHDKQKVAGQALLRGVTRDIDKLPPSEQPGGYRSLTYTWDEKTTKQLENLYKFLTPCKEQIGSLFERYPDIERYAVLYAFSVLKEYAHQGIGSKIMEKCLDVARDCKCDLVFGDFTSFYSQRISRKFGFEVIYEIAFDGNYLNYEELPEDMRKIHKIMSHGVKRIQRGS